MSAPETMCEGPDCTSPCRRGEVFCHPCKNLVGKATLKRIFGALRAGRHQAYRHALEAARGEITKGRTT